MKARMPRHIGMRRQKGDKGVYLVRSIKSEIDLSKIPLHRKKQIA